MGKPLNMAFFVIECFVDDNDIFTTGSIFEQSKHQKNK